MLLSSKRTDVSMEFICEALLSFSKGAVVITFGYLPHVCVYRDGLSFIQGHQTYTVCHLQGGTTQQLQHYSPDAPYCNFYWYQLTSTTVKSVQKQIGSSDCTLVPTPGRVRSASRACTYGALRRPSSHCVSWVSRICFALCCRNRALYPKPRSLRRASTPLPDNYNLIRQAALLQRQHVLYGFSSGFHYFQLN